MQNHLDRASWLAQPFPQSNRLRAARALYTAALVLMPMLLIATPWGLLPAACCTLLAVLLAPDRIWAARRAAGKSLLWLTLAVMLVVAVVSFSIVIHHDTWREADTRFRMLATPLAMLLVLGLAPSRTVLWAGSVLGLVGACIVAVFQTWYGMPRASGWNNAIIFADVAMMLLVLVVFLRPSGRLLITLTGSCSGLIAIGLSGTRGAWPAVLLVMLVGMLTVIADGRARSFKRWLPVSLVVIVVAVIAVLPRVQNRIEDLRHDIQHYEAGDDDTSTGARFRLFGLAVDEIQRAPWTGAGVGHFERVIVASPYCQVEKPDHWCRLGHAHSDFPEWGATMGIPGIIALLVLYGVPAALFLRQLWVRPFLLRQRSAALAGLMLVVSFALCGLSQSMWAHQLSSSTFAILIGVLLGFSLRENPK